MANPNSRRHPPSHDQQWSNQTPTQYSGTQQQPSHSSLPYQPPPQYPPAFQPRTQSSQSHQPSTSTSPSSSTSRTATTNTTSFHHYNPHPTSSASSTTSSTSQPRGERHQITAPFQVPRMPMSWPWPTAPTNTQGQALGQSWVDRSAEGNANANIDPRLLGQGRGHGGHGWPGSSGGQ